MGTVANIIAAKEARESGEDYKWLKMNEYADFTTEEYLAVAEEKTSSSKETKEVTQEAPSLGVMETMIESTAAMNELELPDVSDDIDTRSIYISWCKKFEKEIDEARYPTFMLNYLDMDMLAKESLDMYADCTE